MSTFQEALESKREDFSKRGHSGFEGEILLKKWLDFLSKKNIPELEAFFSDASEEDKRSFLDFSGFGEVTAPEGQPYPNKFTLLIRLGENLGQFLNFENTLLINWSLTILDTHLQNPGIASHIVAQNCSLFFSSRKTPPYLIKFQATNCKIIAAKDPKDMVEIIAQEIILMQCDFLSNGCIIFISKKVCLSDCVSRSDSAFSKLRFRTSDFICIRSRGFKNAHLESCSSVIIYDSFISQLILKRLKILILSKQLIL
jgi:hypothetical protein